MRLKTFLSLLLVAVVLLAGAALLSPWPGVLLIRALFDRGAAAASLKLAPLVPASVQSKTYEFASAESDLALDIYRPSEAITDAPIVVWIHGGGFVSGRRSDVSNYLKILASQGFVVVNVDYTIAPEAAYPTPIMQTNAALAFLIREKNRLELPSSRFVLAGDSAGAQIAAQTAAMIANHDYAERLKIEAGIAADRIAGVLLFCGVYDVSRMGQQGGMFAQFVNVTGWAYSGKRGWRGDADFQTMNIGPWIAEDFPPAFISAGRADPLAPQSVNLANTLNEHGIAVETLFFPPDYAPPLGHEYQFELGTDAGKQALEAAVEWLRRL